MFSILQTLNFSRKIHNNIKDRGNNDIPCFPQGEYESTCVRTVIISISNISNCNIVIDIDI